MQRLQDKVAFVTGGSRGIGAAIVTRLAREGAAVAFTYLKSKDRADQLADEIGRNGGRVLPLCADHADPEEVRCALQRAAADLGGLNILVNNAAIEIVGRIDDYALDGLDLMLTVNIKSVVVAIQEALRHMRRGGRIINIGSVGSDYMPAPEHAIYVMTKGAIASLTRGLVRELGPRGITVNNVQPGRIETEMLCHALGSSADTVRAAMPVGRFGAPDDVAALVGFLAGLEGDYITGAHLKIDGGVTA